MEHRVQIELGRDKIRWRHFVCCVIFFGGPFALQTRLNVAVNQGSIVELKTTGGEQRGANGAAEDGSNTVGIMNHS